MAPIKVDVEIALDAALEMLLWSETVETDDGTMGDSFESAGYATDEIDPSGVADVRGALEGFLASIAEERPYLWSVVVMSLRATRGYMSSDVPVVTALSRWVGDNWILTANRHGAGFWDTGLGRIGDYLTDMAHGASYNLYLGDDDRVYVS